MARSGARGRELSWKRPVGVDRGGSVLHVPVAVTLSAPFDDASCSARRGESESSTVIAAPQSGQLDRAASMRLPH
jgi:hypothetical protein